MKKNTLVILLFIIIILHWYMTNNQEMDARDFHGKIQTTHINKLHNRE